MGGSGVRGYSSLDRVMVRPILIHYSYYPSLEWPGFIFASRDGHTAWGYDRWRPKKSNMRCQPSTADSCR